MQSGDKIAVAGATGRIGRHVVDVLRERGYEPVPMSRSTGVDVVAGTGLDAALAGARGIIDVATDPSGDEQAATEFFKAATRNLQAAGARAGVERITVVSIIGTDRFDHGYNAAKNVQEAEMLAGPVPVRIVRAAQFHEFVTELMAWGTQGDVCFLPRMQTQLVAARAAAETLVDVALDQDADGGIVEVAGPRAESLIAIAELIAARRGDGLRIEAGEDPVNGELFAAGALLPGPGAVLAGPTFADWLDAGGAD